MAAETEPVAYYVSSYDNECNGWSNESGFLAHTAEWVKQPCRGLRPQRGLLDAVRGY